LCKQPLSRRAGANAEVKALIGRGDVLIFLPGFHACPFTIQAISNFEGFMPIYAYKCTDCGQEKEVLQKLNDAPLTDCPACGHASMVKMVTAAGFQLKGSGWYATDFRNKDSGKQAGKADSKAESANDSKADGAKGEPAKADTAKADSAKAPSPAPASGPSTSGTGAGSCG